MAVELDGATLAYGTRVVLRGATLAVEAGEIVGLLGPNGAGKTTLLRALLGLVRPRAGQVRVLGRPARRGNPAVGYVPQTRIAAEGLRLNGWEHVACAAGGTRWGLPWLGVAARRDIGRALDMVDAADLARRPLGEMSGGERQRILLAQALLGQPRLLLLDEPLAGLDLRRQRAAVALVRRLRDELDLAVLFSAHEINPLLGAVDRVLCLGDGEAMLGTVEDVVTGPVLSRLYGVPIEVGQAGGRPVVLADGHAAV